MIEVGIKRVRRKTNHHIDKRKKWGRTAEWGKIAEPYGRERLDPHKNGDKRGGGRPRVKHWVKR